MRLKMFCGRVSKWPEVASGAPIKLPEDAVLADGVQPLLAVAVDEHPLESGFHVDGLAGRMLEVPSDLAGLRIKRQGRIGVEGRVRDRHPPARGHPRLGLGGADVVEAEPGIIAAGDPDIAAGAKLRRQPAPGFVAGMARQCNRGGAPKLPARGGVVPGEEAAIGLVRARSR